MDIHFKVRSNTSSRLTNDRRATPKPRVYVHVKGENVMENLVLRRARPYDFYREHVLPRLRETYGLSSETKIRWSQKAGCGCGCSPGFIIEDLGPNSMLYGKDVWATIHSDPQDNSRDQLRGVPVEDLKRLEKLLA